MLDGKADAVTFFYLDRSVATVFFKFSVVAPWERGPIGDLYSFEVSF